MPLADAHDALRALWANDVVRRIALVALTWLVVFAATRLSSVFFNRLDRRLTQYGVPERRLVKLDTMADLFFVLIGVFVTLFILGIGSALWGAVALTSVAGIIIGLAAQQLGQNLIAGITILLDRPFTVGDFVEVDGRLGEVQKVSLYSTTMRTPDGLMLMVPNSRVLNTSLVNYSIHPDRRILVDIDVREGVRLDEVAAVLLAAVRADEHLVRPAEARAFPKRSLDEGTRFEVQYWVQREAWPVHCWPTAVARLVAALNAAGFELAMPTNRQYAAPDPAQVR